MRREIDGVLALEAVTKRDPRRAHGTNPNSRLSRRRSSCAPSSSHLQERGNTMPETSMYVGVDVAKATLEVASRPEGLKLSVPNTPRGHRELLAALEGRDVKLVVLEATGGYERAIAAELLAAGLNAVVVNPRQVRDFARALGELAKTDSIDAQVLARFAEVVQPKPRPRPSRDEDVLAELVTRRQQLVNLLTQETNRMPHAREKAVKKSLKLMTRALAKQIAELERLIAARIESDDVLREKDAILKSMPGIGPKASAMLLSHLPELGSLNRQEIAALVGVAPWDLQSGGWRGRSRIWGGRAEVRAVLYMAALTAMRCNETIRAFADRLTDAGKAYKVVATACMRKLLVILNTMMRNKAKWQSKNS